MHAIAPANQVALHAGHSIPFTVAACGGGVCASLNPSSPFVSDLLVRADAAGEADPVAETLADLLRGICGISGRGTLITLLQLAWGQRIDFPHTGSGT
jgi:hypothetical protein